MRILVVGGGGREHALAWKLAQSPLAEKIYVAPGNAGTAQVAENIPLKPDDIKGMVEFCKQEGIDLVVPGPELPLTLGLADELGRAGIPCFGPGASCARLEGSKSFAKEIMQLAGVPTARARTFEDFDSAAEYIRSNPQARVIKADGLAAGKGVIVAQNEAQALDALKAMLGPASSNSASARVVVEDKLEGEEVSLLCFCNGDTCVPLPSAQDHKAAYDGDTGPNTGGMGAYSPAPLLPDEKLEAMADLVVRPVLREMARRGQPFTGILYAGLMLTADGPRVLEYNVRFGDPECEPLLMRLKSDLVEIITGALNGTLSSGDVKYSPDAALGVVLAAEGYPGHYQRGMTITGLGQDSDESVIFHAGTSQEGNQIVSTGGRVLCVTGMGKDLAAAQAGAYRRLQDINMAHARFRTDIGAKGLLHLKRQQ